LRLVGDFVRIKAAAADANGASAPPAAPAASSAARIDVAVAVHGTDANAQVFQVRDGVLSDRQSFYLENVVEQGIGEVALEFMLQYYGDQMTIPPQVIVQQEIEEDLAVLGEMFSERRGALS